MQLTQFESQVEAETRRVLREYEPTLADLEMRAEYRGIRIIDAAEATRTSEVEIFLYIGKEVEDALEFFVEKHGVPVAPIGDIETWLREELQDLRRRHL